MIQAARAVLLLFAGILLRTTAVAQEWPQFRGPDGQGHSADRGVPLEWSPTRNVAWKTAVPGRGWSSPIVANGRVWLTTATSGRDGALRLLGYDIDSGREALNAEIFRIGSASLLNEKNSHASPTPVADGDRVYVHFGDEGTAAVTMDGQVLWKTRQRHLTQHGNGASPIVHGDLLIFNCDGADAAFVVALDKNTGKSPLEVIAAAAVVAGLHDAADCSERRAGTAGQRRRVLYGGVRAADRQGDLARQLS